MSEGGPVGVLRVRFFSSLLSCWLEYVPYVLRGLQCGQPWPWRFVVVGYLACKREKEKAE